MSQTDLKDRLHKVLRELVHSNTVKNQMDFSTQLGINKSHMSEIMNGRKPITEGLVNSVCVKFGISELWLKEGIGEMFNKDSRRKRHFHEGKTLRKYWIQGVVDIPYAADLLGVTEDYIERELSKDVLSQEFKNLMALKQIEKEPDMLFDRLEAAFIMNPDPNLFVPLDQEKAKEKPEIITLGKQAPSKASNDEWEGLPMYNIPISASFVEMYRDEKATPQYYLSDPRFRDCNFGAIVTGDSMHGEIRHGDFVVCKEVTDTRFIVYGEIYYVVATNGLETCKYVNQYKNEDYLLLVPKNEKISPSPIPKDMILKMYKVRGIIRGY